VADEWVTHLLRQGDAQVFKKYLQRKLMMKKGGVAEAEQKSERGLVQFLPRGGPTDGVLSRFCHGWGVAQPGSAPAVLAAQVEPKKFAPQECIYT
jgi:hypothetical protein